VPACIERIAHQLASIGRKQLQQADAVQVRLGGQVDTTGDHQHQLGQVARSRHDQRPDSGGETAGVGLGLLAELLHRRPQRTCRHPRLELFPGQRQRGFQRFHLTGQLCAEHPHQQGKHHQQHHQDQGQRRPLRQRSTADGLVDQCVQHHRHHHGAKHHHDQLRELPEQDRQPGECQRDHHACDVGADV